MFQEAGRSGEALIRSLVDEVEFAGRREQLGSGRLAGMDRLRELDLNDSGVTDAGLARLAVSTRLKRLRLANTGITGRRLSRAS
jgi:hypothetical protein